MKLNFLLEHLAYQYQIFDDSAAAKFTLKCGEMARLCYKYLSRASVPRNLSGSFAIAAILFSYIEVGFVPPDFCC